MESCNRREFIKASSVLTGTAALSTSNISSVFAGGSDVIRIALVGCGGRGTGAASDALQSGQNVKLVALADVFQDNLDKAYINLSKKFGEQGRCS
ncbi:twin-arginine translocation signal domain-containing protein [Sphingobacterium sp. T2]|uniref:twin-arginine translocation signal domain-containing protein n=1 Tax=Sphingobacterium sp. T2 TaxID=1590596 RepID=UPI000B2B6A8E|nr:twin-arginine translocation signal domain-containing protein [Sphingobacterium sp. T2]